MPPKHRPKVDPRTPFDRSDSSSRGMRASGSPPFPTSKKGKATTSKSLEIKEKDGDSIPSKLRESDKDRLISEFDLRGDAAYIVIPSKNDRVCNPPPSLLSVYEYHLRLGVRLPLSPFLIRTLEFTGLGLTQLMPLAAALLLGFEALLVSLGFENLSPALFFKFFRPIKSSEGSWFAFRAKSNSKIFGGLPSKLKCWKEKFFFIPMSADPRLSPYWNWTADLSSMPTYLTETEESAAEVIATVIEDEPLDLFTFLRPLIPPRWRAVIVPQPAGIFLHVNTSTNFFFFPTRPTEYDLGRAAE